ncbi:hypothetical protein A9G24_11955 [Gilliamella sp. App6-5]|uniref:hypothetical protein n=1 Tax=Gilliamella sp. App6-5 TaxID=3120232 RepID=UPI00080DC94E|nr:hypothetical protein [Gilliamella apicola]OCG18944.1 hypothetical protein A9G24_11955 [Gilliamella apicola]
MAEWTGVMYGFYTNKSIDDVFSAWFKKLASMNYQCERSRFRNDEFLFCYKNDEMQNYHLEYGYNLDINGEGCFCIEAKSTKLHGTATLFKFDNDSDFEPYDINLHFQHVFYYVLVLPDLIENSRFCQNMHRLFTNILNEKKMEN